MRQHLFCVLTLVPWTCSTVVDAKYLDRHLASGASVADIKPLHEHTPGGVSADDRSAAAVARIAKASALKGGNSSVNEVFNQIAFADIVLLNKIDLVSDESAVKVETAIREINSLARVVHTRLNDDDCPNWLSTVRPCPCFLPCLERCCSRCWFTDRVRSDVHLFPGKHHNEPTPEPQKQTDSCVLFYLALVIGTD